MFQAWNAARRSASSSSARRVARSSLIHGSSVTAPSSYRHAPATAPSTRNVAVPCGFLTWKTRGRRSSGRMPVRRAWTSSVASQTGRKRTGAGVSGSGSGAPGRSSSSSPSAAAVADRVDPLQGGREVAELEAGEARDVGARRRAEAAQVAAHEVVDRLRRGDLHGRDPILGRRVQIGAAVLPGARRRHAHHVQPQADAAGDLLAEQLLDLLAVHRAVGQAAAGACARPPAICAAVGPRTARSHDSRRACRTATANGQ